MSVKIGILTTFFSPNYGAALQAYSLYVFLEKYCYEPEFINYRKGNVVFYVPENMQEREQKLSFFQLIMRKSKNAFIKLSKKLPRDSNSKLRDEEFIKFISKFLKIGDTLYTSEKEFIDAVPGMSYDVFLCGSDQIWNPMVHNFDQVYYLNFKTNAKKIAYAPSIAYNQFTEREIKRICDSIRSIDYISVREKSTIIWLQPYIEKKIHHVIDPTFLLSKNEWLTLPSEKRIEGNYILVYLLNYNEQNENITKLISRYAKENQYKIICLPYTNIKFPKDIHVEYRYDIAPNDFIHLLNGAECIITNSFHATALSINFNKPFFVVSSRFRNQGLQTRLSDLLELTKLEHRKIYPDTEYIKDFHNIDYEAVNEVISVYRKYGEEYLLHAIGD